MNAWRHFEDSPVASGGPGISPRWTHSAKDVVGTAYATASRVWFTVSRGVISEVYFPTIDRPQIRDLQFLVSDGETFFHDAHRAPRIQPIEYLGEHAARRAHHQSPIPKAATRSSRR